MINVGLNNEDVMNSVWINAFNRLKMRLICITLQGKITKRGLIKMRNPYESVGLECFPV